MRGMRDETQKMLVSLATEEREKEKAVSNGWVTVEYWLSNGRGDGRAREGEGVVRERAV